MHHATRVEEARREEASWSRRQFVKLAPSFTLMLAGGFATPSHADQPDLVAAAEKEGGVMVYGDSSMVPQLVAGFAKRYPKIRVSSVPGGGWDTYNRIVIEKGAGRTLADVFVANDDTVLTGSNAGMWDKLGTTASYPADSVVDAANYVIVYRMLTTVMYNTEATKGLTMPKDWDDFAHLGDEWKGLIITADPRNSGTALCVLTALYQTYGKERASAILAGLKRSGVEIAPNTGVQVAKIMSGERPLSVTLHMAFFMEMKKKGAPVDYLLPASGAMMQVDGMAVTKGAPHPNAGRLFVDFTMSPEGAAIVAENGDYPAGSDSVAPAGFPLRPSLKIMGQGPAEMIRDRQAVIDWWKSAMGVT